MNKKYQSLTFAFSFLAIACVNAQNRKTDSLLTKFNQELSKKAPEDSLANLAAKYGRLVNRQSAYDSLTKQIIEIYPKGTTALFSDLQNLYEKAGTGDLTLSELDQIKEKYPNQNFSNPQSGVGSYYAAIISSGFPNFLEKDSSKATNLIPTLNTSSLNAIAWSFAESNKHLPTAEKMSKLSIDKLKKSIADSSKIDADKRAATNAELFQTLAANEDTYAFILSKLGKNKEALQYQEEAVKYKSDDVDMNTRYIALLNENGDYKNALSKGSNWYKKDLGNEEMLRNIGIAFKKENPKKPWDTYAATLDVDKKTTANANLAKSQINLPAKDFKLKDLTGKEVALSDFKGKVVVVDFWATWCGHCKMSFPGMQLAINKYKANKDVVFLFVDTWESTEPAQTKEAVAKFIAEKKYSFQVLLDQKVGDKEFDAAGKFSKAYGIDGIPTKFFIGKDGNVKFKAVGYPGSDDKVVQEVSKSVDYLLSGS